MTTDKATRLERGELGRVRAELEMTRRELAFMTMLAASLNRQRWGDDPAVRVDLDRALRVLERRA